MAADIADVIARLRAAIDECGTQREFCYVAGISRGHLVGVLSGKRAPGPKVLKALGLDPTVKLVTEVEALRTELEQAQLALEWICDCAAHFYTVATPGGTRLDERLRPWAGPLKSVFGTARQALGASGDRAQLAENIRNARADAAAAQQPGAAERGE